MAGLEYLEQSQERLIAKIAKLDASIQRMENGLLRNIETLKRYGVREEDIDYYVVADRPGPNEFLDDEDSYVRELPQYRKIVTLMWDVYRTMHRYIPQEEDELEEAKNKLTDVEKKLTVAKRNEVNRTDERILDFLEDWKVLVLNYLKEHVEDYETARREYNRATTEYNVYYNSRKYFGITSPDSTIDNIYKNIEAEYNKYKFLKPYADAWGFDSSKLNDHLNLVSKEIYDSIVPQIQSIVGTITDTTNIQIGPTGELSGIVMGTEGDAQIYTTGRGLGNVRKFASRVRVKSV